METVRSADGTAIAYDRVGSGPALVIALGAFCDRRTPQGLAALLGEHFTVYSYDRRGRGDSGDAPAYAVRREVEDLAAVIAAAGGSAVAYGHSSGASLVLAAAVEGLPITRLAAYEPPYTEIDELYDRIRGMVAAGDQEGAVAAFMTDALHVPSEALAGMRQSPAWPELVRFANTLPYDMVLGTDPGDALAKISVPALALTGADSPAWMREVAARVARTIPGGELMTLAGQEHRVADEVLASVLVDFFTR